MNKGFAYYFRQAFKLSAKTVWKNKNLLSGMLYFFTTLIARLTIILGAMVDLADVRAAKIAKAQQTIDLPQSLTRASQKPLWTMIVARVLELLIYLGGFLLVSIPCGVIIALGLAIAQFAAPSSAMLILIIFAVPCLIIYAVYTIIVITIFAPTAYVIETNPTLSAGEAVSVCVNSMKSRGKMTVFLCVFIPALIMGAILGLCAGGCLLLLMLLKGASYAYLIAIVWAIISLVILGFTIPVFNMTQNLSLVLLFEDIALDPVNAQKRTAGINIKRITGAKVDREEVADNLDALFDEGIDERYPEESELVHKHKKKRKKKPVSVEVPAAGTQGAATTVVTEESEADLADIDEYANEAPAPQPAPKPEQPAQQAPQQPQQAQQAQPAQQAPQQQPEPQRQPPQQPEQGVQSGAQDEGSTENGSNQ